MSINWEKWTPELAITICRIFGLLFLSLLWLQVDGNKGGVILLLFLAILALARWRLPLPGWTVLIDQTVCLIFVIYFPFAAFALAFPLFETLLKRQPWFALPVFIFTILYPETSILLVVTFIQAGLSGAILGGWDQDTNRYQRESDRQRRDHYELENLKEELLIANAQGTRMAELTERNRIAQQLHDDVGHELTASVLALQAFEELWKENDPDAKEMFAQAQQRLSKSAVYLRETVHNIKPVKELGIEGMHEISDQFTLCPVKLNVYGDTGRVPVHLWGILYPTLKEALTNVIRHAQPTLVEISLDISPHILRLSVSNDGVTKDKGDRGTGVGLRNLRHRAKAVGGSISLDTSDGFLLICVLPIE
ncbi:sensor histidine kinase [Alkalihalobacillus sp. MEB130]|uniref:sensor histidine kinase n=1 Tax=Alkalihalobacillus sp. MEB130 TaxID=2976704 RepID=UPI0028E05BC5|nr:sensor histidine kinase [Alkalihalobacillus sp. MEB130]MDT8861846.1 sensor histidine kinase [Alkalihalobacillus sp. MEB130]